MRARVAAVAVVAAAAALLLGTGLAGGTAAPGTHAAKTVSVKIGDDPDTGDLFFKPRRITIRRGTRVRWVWVGELKHQLKGRRVRSKLRAAPYTYRVRFRRRAKRRFICFVHPSMRMTVVVR